MTKVLISLQDELLCAVDAAARQDGLTRSAYLARLATDDLATRRRARSQQRKAALRKIDQIFARNPSLGDVAAFIREDRDSH